MVRGDRYVGHKPISKLARAHGEGDAGEVRRLRRLLERNYLVRRVRRRLVAETVDPLKLGRGGGTLERRELVRFASRGRRG